MQSRTPTKEEKEWMNKVADMGCIVCSEFYGADSPAEVHHLDGKTKKGAHLLTIPLCYRHHREGANNKMYVSRHPYLYEFEKRYGTQESLLEKVKEYV
jgi:hypothetical protein